MPRLARRRATLGATKCRDSSHANAVGPAGGLLRSWVKKPCYPTQAKDAAIHRPKRSLHYKRKNSLQTAACGN